MRQMVWLPVLVLLGATAGCGGSPAERGSWQVVQAYKEFNAALESLQSTQANTDEVVRRIQSRQQRLMELLKKLQEFEDTITEEERQRIQKDIAPVLKKEVQRTGAIIAGIVRENPTAMLKVAASLAKLPRGKLGKGVWPAK